jgi:hypothetical protein
VPATSCGEKVHHRSRRLSVHSLSLRTDCLVSWPYVRAFVSIDNMIFSSDSSEVAAVLDWELSTLGDSMADVASHLMVYYIPPGNHFLRGYCDCVYTACDNIQ